MEIRKQIQHFEKHRELRGVLKQPLEQDGAVPDGLWVRQQVEDLFQSSRALDNAGHDYDGRRGHILRWADGMGTAANFHSVGEKKTLDRDDVTSYRRDTYRVRQDSNSIDYLDALQERDGYSQVQCWHLDLKNWNASFYQCL